MVGERQLQELKVMKHKLVRSCDSVLCRNVAFVSPQLLFLFVPPL